MEETGVAAVADPLGGSWYVEALTDRIEQQAEEMFAAIRDMGEDGSMIAGILVGIDNGWFTKLTADAAFAYQNELEKGTKRVVGVNVHTDSVVQPLEVLRIPRSVETEQVRSLVARRERRDPRRVEEALKRVVEVSQGTSNVVPVMLDAVRAEATMGEICDAMKTVFGGYVEQSSF
jgi:methylmalonyl-CoA mutase N-terminal domain/subunit